MPSDPPAPPLFEAGLDTEPLIANAEGFDQLLGCFVRSLITKAMLSGDYREFDQARGAEVLRNNLRSYFRERQQQLAKTKGDKPKAHPQPI